MKLTGLSEKVFLDRYSLKDKKGNPIEKTPDRMWKRIAKAVAAIEKKEDQKKWEREFYEAMSGFKYVPGGRILAGAGTGFEVTYYNCFVIPSPRDSREGILDSLKQMVEIMARGGGVGINLSSLRPRGQRVEKVNGFSSGPCNWAELFSVATKDIIQQGGTRRGALMLMLWDWHPDVEEFITVKQDLARINGANLSVCVSDSFMEAVEKDLDWELVFPDKKDPEYDTKWNGDIFEWKAQGKKVIVHKKVKARAIWDLVAEAAWKSAEPGVVFMERYNKLHNNWYWNRINCVNPCGEEGLPPWGVCNLGSINLSSLVRGNNIDKKGVFDFKTLRKVIRAATRFQDNVIDMDTYVFEGIRETQLEGERRIGLGTMGLGDTLIKLHLRYGSAESLKFIERVYRIIRDEAYRTSVEVAAEKGHFGKFDKKLYPQGKFIRSLPEDIQESIKEKGIRNSILLMQAPTGSTSLMVNTTSGIEPVFEFEFVRRDRIGEHVILHHLYEKWYQKHKADIESGKILRPSWFVSANDLTPEDHIKVQAAIQKYVDASISKTVNAPKTHTVEDVKKLYTLAYKLGCKGIAYMRDGSRAGVLERVDDKKKEENQPEIKQAPAISKRPPIMYGLTYKTQTPLGDAFITINKNENGDPFEAFVTIGKSGSDVAAMTDALGRMISITLRLQSPVPARERIRQIVAQLSGIGGMRTVGFGENRVRSVPDAVAKVLAEEFGFSVNGVVKDLRKNELSQSNGQTLPAGPLRQSSSEANKQGNGKASGGIVPNGQVLSSSAQITPASQSAVSADTVVMEQLSISAEPSTPIESVSTQSSFDLCPSCGGASLAHEEGCKKCYSCGYSEC
ncbi:MAG: ribonucleoside-diphosphate reductase [Candidatus Levybacteria bacterium RIFCSPHIGHO2_02_FULL_39_36]|nr:MAG: Ribonucleoside-diphosphate reductase [Candidatus Levybacteria bacterium GW2011_GWA1_39_11]KKR24484.1 MAG: Ribonucleoside-diphosphate reductase [Candidatus Levybacteria bacterium GW2011_GWB1_39_7]KKR49477.1 MAG: Ribonucleoside-diphosphate reductase [Candidatus Levybacteria bacterium GW2011_GWA2_40_16]OGH15318.1 MAG: ribonucleoside-diphosphate reductase [Candidatus Levybacteria bacterium RIFCSPHIGHO2_01_FULL_38_96]OGH26519.1 MAG: ribonucleoside-diphosphate reductase [Candidatus Levybacter